MIVWREIADVPAGFGPSVVAIGKFDGVHTGHRAVLDRARVDAAATGSRVVAVTFDRNPLALLQPDRCPPELVSVSQKVDLLAREGVDATLVLSFDRALADLEAAEFVRRVLVRAVGARRVLVGADFRFGRGGEGDPALLQRLGEEHDFAVDVIDDIGAQTGGRRVSSTWIRELLAAGDVSGAARLLGRPHALRGEVVQGEQRGRELGFPTANLASDAEGFVPADGVYAGWLVDFGPHDAPPRIRTRYPAAISVGTNPTFDDVTERRVEAYVLDETDLDLYGHRVELQFVQRLRPMTAFDGIEPLIQAMHDDVAQAREILR